MKLQVSVHARNVPGLTQVRSLAFDIFGTVVDWRRTIVREGVQLGSSVDWGSFADEWMQGYRSQVERVRKGERPWANLDALLQETFEGLVVKYKLGKLPAKRVRYLSEAWHRLRPWRDVLPGLARLSKRYTLGTLSNGNMILLTDMKRYSKLPWDCILSAELCERYKPEKEAYTLAASFLGPESTQVMYVASHKWDLTAAAQTVGLRTAFIPRPKEMPGIDPSELKPDPSYDINAKDLMDLATQLGC